MKKTILLLLFTILVSCNSRKINGVYYYEESKDKSVNFFDIGSAAKFGNELACSMIGQFEFKNGKCYFSMMGVEQRCEYQIEDSVIYLGSNALNSGGVGLKIINENTIEYMGCLFKKDIKNK